MSQQIIKDNLQYKKLHSYQIKFQFLQNYQIPFEDFLHQFHNFSDKKIVQVNIAIVIIRSVRVFVLKHIVWLSSYPIKFLKAEILMTQFFSQSK